MDCYWHEFDHMEIWSIWWDKTGNLPVCSHVSTIAWLHYSESNETLWEKVKWMLRKLECVYCTFIFHHHHHVVPLSRISMTLSRHFSLSFIASGRSSGQHPVSSHSCWMYVRAGRPAFSRPCVAVHKSTSLMSSSLLLQQCPACLVRLTWIVFRDRRQVAVQLVSCGVLPPGLVQDCSQHSCVIAV